MILCFTLAEEGDNEEACQEDVYLKELVRYIHLNPSRARLVSEMKGLDRYRSRGYDFSAVVERVANLLDLEVNEILRSGKQPQIVKARSLICFWANRQLGMTTVEIARRLGICQSAVSRSSLRGEKMAEENQFRLV